MVQLRAEAARAEARAVDTAMVDSEMAGPLHGVPVTIKDAYDVAGTVTTGGTLAAVGSSARLPPYVECFQGECLLCSVDDSDSGLRRAFAAATSRSSRPGTGARVPELPLCDHAWPASITQAKIAALQMR